MVRLKKPDFKKIILKTGFHFVRDHHGSMSVYLHLLSYAGMGYLDNSFCHIVFPFLL